MQFCELTNRLNPTLKKIVFKFNKLNNYFDYEDLYQETLIHLWNFYNKGYLKDKTDSFILQGCYFYLKNFIKNKRNKPIFSLDDFTEEREGEIDKNLFDPHLENNQFEAIENNMLIKQLLSNKLTERESEILFYISEGKTFREIGKVLGISHVSVIKTLKNIRNKLNV